jgi:hypothetical protein
MAVMATMTALEFDGFSTWRLKYHRRLTAMHIGHLMAMESLELMQFAGDEVSDCY